MSKPREWKILKWARVGDEFINGPDTNENEHVIEYSAYEALRKERDELKEQAYIDADRADNAEKERDAWKKLSDSQEVSLNSFRSERSQLLQERDAYREALEKMALGEFQFDNVNAMYIAREVLAKYNGEKA